MKNVTSTQLRSILEKVTKWRGLLAGWQLGTRPSDDPEAQAVRDQRELLIMLRIEVSAMTTLLINSKVFSVQDWTDEMANEATEYDKGFSRRFPGVTSSEDGLVIDVKAAKTWMKGWKP